MHLCTMPLGNPNQLHSLHEAILSNGELRFSFIFLAEVNTVKSMQNCINKEEGIHIAFISEGLLF